MRKFGRHAREARLAEMDAFRHARRAAHEDVTCFGEELSELHFDTLTTALDETMRRDYEHALGAYESAKADLATAERSMDVTGVTRILADGRFSHACVLAARDGAVRPTRRELCFFDPSHGPAERDLEWAPPGGVPREIPVCFRDYELVTTGSQPQARLVKVGNRQVPWFASGPMYATWAQGWYSGLADPHRFQTDRLTMAFVAASVAGTAGQPTGMAWSDPGSWEGGGLIGGHDYSGWSGDIGSGGDGAGGLDGGGGGGGDAGGGF